MPSIIAFGRQTVHPEYDCPRPDRVIEGNPRRTTWNHYANASGEVFAGVWASEVGSWRIEMGDTEDEFFFVTEGRCRLTDENGVSVEVGPGESLVIPAGFTGAFAVLEPVKKHYMIVDRKR